MTEDIKPLFSICIPLYNHEKYVGQTIQSVLDQDFEDFEIIVADNCSTDGSREVVKAFDDPRIRLIENRYNIGFAPNLQQVTRFARGRFINLLSSDDVMQPGALRTYAELINKHEADADRLVLSSQAWEIDGADNVFRYITKHPNDFAPHRVQTPTQTEIERQPYYEAFQGFDVFTKSMRNLNTVGIFCTVTYSRQLWEAVEGYNSLMLISPDMDFILKVLRLNPVYIYVNRPLYSYRKHLGGQNAQQRRSRVLKRHVDYYIYLMKFDEGWLEGTNVTPLDQRQVFLNRDCITLALTSLARGQWLYALRVMAFGIATYPGVAVQMPGTHVTMLLLMLGPVGILLTRLLYTNYKKGKQMKTLTELANNSALSQQSPSCLIE